MAVQATPAGSELLIRVQTGQSSTGNPVYANRRYDDVKSSAADGDVHEVGRSIASLQSKLVAGIQRVNILDLEEV